MSRPDTAPRPPGPPAGPPVDPVVARAARLLSGLPLGRACGLDPGLADDAALLAAGAVPRLRIAVAGPAAGPVRAWLETVLADTEPAPECAAGPAGCHLLLFAVADRSGPPDEEERRAAAPVTAALAATRAPRAVMVVTTPHDWHGVGLSAVAGWHRQRLREWWGPAAAALPVYAVVPDWWAEDPAYSGLESLLHQVVRPAVEGARGVVTALTLTRLTSAFQEVRLEGRAQAAALGWALDACGLPRPPGRPEPPDLTRRAELWHRLDVYAAAPPARRAARRLRTAARARPGAPHPTPGERPDHPDHRGPHDRDTREERP
ncbi:hypothetical protein ACWEQL_17310 [Kitasatospora sp. NPDC004240]